MARTSSRRADGVQAVSAPASARAIAALAELRAALRESGFEAGRLQELLDCQSMFANHARHLPRAAFSGVEPPLRTFVELFLADRPVELDSLRAALSDDALEGLGECGLLTVAGSTVRSPVALEPFEDVVLIGDVPALGERALDHAPAASPSSLRLAKLTVRREARQALDLGTGAGFQALLAARHAGHVVGVDVNSHALRLAAVAGRLNERANIELREGSWLEPVDDGARFDLIVANPPFLAALEVTWRYAESQRPDKLSGELIRAAAERLTEGGIAHVLCAWGLRAGDDWLSVPAGWVEGCGCDALIFCFEIQAAADYAAGPYRFELSPDREKLDAEVEQGIAHLEGMGADRIAFGLAVLRRRAGENWVRAVPSSGPNGSAGAQVERMLAAGDVLASNPSPDDLLATAFEPAPGLMLVQRLRSAEQGFRSDPVEVFAEPGAGVSVHLEPAVAALVTACDGRASLGALADALARDTGRETSALALSAAAAARQLVATGLLAPREPS